MTGKKRGKRSKKVYCLCQKPNDPELAMIACDACDDWFHQSCLGLSDEQWETAMELERYYCPQCEGKGDVDERPARSRRTGSKTAERSERAERGDRAERSERGTERRSTNGRRGQSREASQENGASNNNNRGKPRKTPKGKKKKDEEGSGEDESDAPNKAQSKWTGGGSAATGAGGDVGAQGAGGEPYGAQLKDEGNDLDDEVLDPDGEQHLKSALEQFLATQPPTLSPVELEQYKLAYCRVYRQQWREHTRRQPQAQAQYPPGPGAPPGPPPGGQVDAQGQIGQPPTQENDGYSTNFPQMSGEPEGLHTMEAGQPLLSGNGNLQNLQQNPQQIIGGQSVPMQMTNTEPQVEADLPIKPELNQEAPAPQPNTSGGPVPDADANGDAQNSQNLQNLALLDNEALARSIAQLLIEQFAPQMGLQLVAPLTLQLSKFPPEVLQSIFLKCRNPDPQELLQLMQRLLHQAAEPSQSTGEYEQDPNNPPQAPQDPENTGNQYYQNTSVEQNSTNGPVVKQDEAPQPAAENHVQLQGDVRTKQEDMQAVATSQGEVKVEAMAEPTAGGSVGPPPYPDSQMLMNPGYIAMGGYSYDGYAPQTTNSGGGPTNESGEQNYPNAYAGGAPGGGYADNSQSGTIPPMQYGTGFPNQYA